MLAKILKLKQEQQFDAALFEINAAGKKLLRLDIEMLADFDEENLIRTFHPAKNLDAMSCLITAELLLAKVELEPYRNKKKDDLRKKALRLFLEAVTTLETLLTDGVMEKIFRLEKQLENSVLSEGTLRAQFRLREYRADYGDAENYLFRWANFGSLEALQEGVKFYWRLHRVSDTQLLSGGLPREELDDGLADLRRLFE
mgnify:CR=1 FL=1